MKRIIVLITCLALVFAAVSGCAGKKQADTLTGTVQEILQSVTDSANEILPENSKMAGAFTDPVTADNSENAIGLTGADFDKYVSEAYVSQAMMMTSAHQVAVVKCKDFASADEVKKLVASGFNSGKWICVVPDKSTVVESGTYILLVVSSTEYTDAALSAFKTLAKDNVGTANTFYESN